MKSCDVRLVKEFEVAVLAALFAVLLAPDTGLVEVVAMLNSLSIASGNDLSTIRRRLIAPHCWPHQACTRRATFPPRPARRHFALAGVGTPVFCHGRFCCCDDRLVAPPPDRSIRSTLNRCTLMSC